MFFSIRVGDIIDRKELMGKLVARQYQRNDMDLIRGTFRVRGDVIEVALGHTDSYILRIEMFDDEIERICEVDPLTGKVQNAYTVYVAVSYTHLDVYKRQDININDIRFSAVIIIPDMLFQFFSA